MGLTDRRGSEHAILDPYSTPAVVETEDRLLRAVCSELRDHPGVWAWSLGNEPDLFCRPADPVVGRTWVRDRVAMIKAIDPSRPVLIGLHGASLEADPGFRVGDIAAETDISVMHGYSIYSRLARSPLDPDYVPFTAALAAALAGRPVLYEEFGVNTGSPDGPSGWRDLPMWDGRTRRAYFASEDDAAAYMQAVLQRLVRVGSLGAFVWCFADYHPSLWDRPPCNFQVHERFFGLVRPDGSLKPSAMVIREFAASAPVVREGERPVTIPTDEAGYYRRPLDAMMALYEAFGHL